MAQSSVSPGTNVNSVSLGTNVNSSINYNDPYFLSSNDNSNSQLGHIIFTGNNYVNWNRSVSLALGAKNKLIL